MTMNFEKARENMVEQQVRPWEVLDPRVLGVIGQTPRELFVEEAWRELAYADIALPLGTDGQTMMKPVIEGRVLQALEVTETARVLEIGTGSGYLTACLAQLGKEVLSLEIDPARAAAATARLAAQGYENVTVEVADALAWQPGSARFDVICVTGAVAEIPPKWQGWLAPGGRMLVICGQSPAMEAVRIHADVNGTRREALFETDLPYLAGAAPVPVFTL